MTETMDRDRFPTFALIVAALLAVLALTGCDVTDPDTAPTFADTVEDQAYTVGAAITPLRLPAASGGNGELTYSLSPAVPGLRFNPITRTLSGTLTTAGTYAMTYAAEDEDADSAELTFTITVQPPDTAPSFGAQTVSDHTYTVGAPITPLRLPAASGGNGELTYSLSPAVPGLRFNPITRTLSGTPTVAGRGEMTYRVTDEDGDAAVLRFTIVVQEAQPPDTAPSFGPAPVSWTVNR